ncbi:DUF167 domain-containing protein [Facilibium subflavum]|uniref:DUF167 domain-containing protein n=1 Tax=Facilibium subflavum TaxID=2219058 RepID=UPI001AAE0A33|nr:DUF167 domain-containing protein [Facilibium subflavum]
MATEKEVITFSVHIKPNSKTNQLLGYHGDAVKIALKAAPVDGKANEALIAALAKWFGVTKAQVSIVKGKTARSKLVRIECPKCELKDLIKI